MCGVCVVCVVCVFTRYTVHQAVRLGVHLEIARFDPRGGNLCVGCGGIGGELEAGNVSGDRHGSILTNLRKCSETDVKLPEHPIYRF